MGDDNDTLIISIRDLSHPIYYGILFFMTIIPIVTTGTASFAVGAKYEGVKCGGTMMPLPTWLLTYAIAETIYLLVIIGLSLARRKVIVSNLIFLLAWFNQTMVFIWIIVGATALFRDSADCYAIAYSAWALVLAIFIIQMIVLTCKFVICCCFCTCETCLRIGLGH